MPEAAAVLATLCWSAGFVISRPLLAHLSVFRTNLLRLLGPAVLFPSLVLSLGLLPEFQNFGWHNYAALVAAAVLGIGLTDAGMIHAMRLIGLARAYTLGNISTLFAVLWAGLILRESITPALVWAALITVMGVTLTTSRGGAGQGEAAYGTRQFWFGVALAAGVAATWGMDLVMIRIGIGDGHPLVANTIRVPASLAVATVALLVREPPGSDSAPMTLPLAARGIAGGLVGLGGGGILFLYAIQQLGAAQAGVLASLSPIWGLLLAVIFLGERPSRRQVLGVLLAISGIILLVVAN